MDNNENIEVMEMDIDKIEQYQEFIKDFKVRMSLEAGLLDDDTKNLIRECRDEIINLRHGIEKMKNENAEIFEDCREMASILYKLEQIEYIKDKKVKNNVQDFFELYEHDELFMNADNIERVVTLFKEN